MLIRRKKLNIEPKEVQTEKVAKEVMSVQKEEVTNVVSDFDIDNFDFLQRDERRRGDRRRGYRRIDDRNLVSRAQAEALSIKEEAVKDGYNEGLEKAKADVANLKEELKSFYGCKDKAVEVLSKEILEIALDVAQTIIKKEVEQDKEILLNTIVDILKTNVKAEDRITLKVCEEDVEFVKMSIPQMLSMAQVSVKVSVVARDNVEKGSVIVETSSGIVDASFKTQLEVLREAFKGI